MNNYKNEFSFNLYGTLPGTAGYNVFPFVITTIINGNCVL